MTNNLSSRAPLALQKWQKVPGKGCPLLQGPWCTFTELFPGLWPWICCCPGTCSAGHDWDLPQPSLKKESLEQECSLLKGSSSSQTGTLLTVDEIKQPWNLYGPHEGAAECDVSQQHTGLGKHGNLQISLHSGGNWGKGSSEVAPGCPGSFQLREDTSMGWECPQPTPCECPVPLHCPSQGSTAGFPSLLLLGSCAELRGCHSWWPRAARGLSHASAPLMACATENTPWIAAAHGFCSLECSCSVWGRAQRAWPAAQNCPAPLPGCFGISGVSEDTRGLGWGRGSCPDRNQCSQTPAALGHHQPSLSAPAFSHPTHPDQFLPWKSSTGTFVSPLHRTEHQTPPRDWWNPQGAPAGTPWPDPSALLLSPGSGCPCPCPLAGQCSPACPAVSVLPFSGEAALSLWLLHDHNNGPRSSWAWEKRGGTLWINPRAFCSHRDLICAQQKSFLCERKR